MELTRLRSFIVLAERLHFGEAARLLHLSQPALSKQIRQLEVEIGAPLFERGRHGARLTEVGSLFAEEARRLLRQADAALEQGRRAARGEVGRLAIGFGFSTVTLVPRVISKFRLRHPGVEIELRDMSTPEQIDALRASRIHVGFVRLPAGRGLRQTPVLEDRLALALPAPDKESHKPGALSGYRDSPFIALRRDQSLSLHEHIIRLCARYGFHPRVVQEANEYPTVLGLVASGLGVALVPESQLRTRIEGVTIQCIEDPAARWQVGAAWLRGKSSPLTAEFLALLKEDLSLNASHTVPTWDQPEHLPGVVAVRCGRQITM
jgi:DNA-binding transcriptional LysR family regulator